MNYRVRVKIVLDNWILRRAKSSCYYDTVGRETDRERSFFLCEAAARKL